MRKIININENWIFKKTDRIECIHIPHTWNHLDGQDGGNDYYRGKCTYIKKLDVPDLTEGQKAYLEFCGVNSSATVYLNDQRLTHHDGGYSTFRVDITPALAKENQLVVEVDNSYNPKVYPQKADFTFYGGIYRDVNLIIVNENHFSLDQFGSPGIMVTPTVEGKDATVTFKSFVSGTGIVRYTIPGIGSTTGDSILIPDARLWEGLNDPYLYTVKAELIKDGVTVDKIEIKFGCRSFSFDKELGFILNGKPYPLRGVSRHQDFKEVGNAITTEMQDIDMDLMMEIGANTIRLAHYQHSQYFYDLCNEKGMIVWAEIPYITEHMPEANENTISQLTELIYQNYNHPSIVCWGLSNEITAVGGDRPEILENHKVLNDLSHKLDPTRPTTMAHVFMLDIESELVALSDIASYNLYYGWYLGELNDNDQFFDTFHEKYPDRIIGFSEYGADANPKLHNNKPERGDYTEDYQAIYHEHLIKMIHERPYLWATHVWNMFDFAADGRDEGGEHGLNQKGLVSFDRKLKKDAFYIYKAYWSSEPFVHLCGLRYMDRTEETTEIKVYSNCSSVTLYVDGKWVAEQEGEKIFTFHVPLHSEHEITVVSGVLEDRMTIRKVKEDNPEYAMPKADIINWFDQDEIILEGCFTVKNTIGEISAVPEGAALIKKLMDAARATRGDVSEGIKMNDAMVKAINATTLEKMLMQAGNGLEEEFLEHIVKSIYKLQKPTKA